MLEGIELGKMLIGLGHADRADDEANAIMTEYAGIDDRAFATKEGQFLTSDRRQHFLAEVLIGLEHIPTVRIVAVKFL